MKIALAVGTVSGNANLVAEFIVDWLAERGHRGEILAAAATPKDVMKHEALLVVTATCGHGELPASLEPFARALVGARLNRFPCGVIGLGDSLYGESFGQAGKTMTRILSAAGGAFLTPPLSVDAGRDPQPERPAEQWIASWIAALEAHTTTTKCCEAVQ